jgi:hypothetical protein
MKKIFITLSLCANGLFANFIFGVESNSQEKNNSSYITYYALKNEDGEKYDLREVVFSEDYSKFCQEIRSTSALFESKEYALYRRGRGANYDFAKVGYTPIDRETFNKLKEKNRAIDQKLSEYKKKIEEQEQKKAKLAQEEQRLRNERLKRPITKSITGDALKKARLFFGVIKEDSDEDGVEDPAHKRQSKHQSIINKLRRNLTINELIIHQQIQPMISCCG